MPNADWGISKSDIDDFDRSKQFKPYTGPIPPMGQVFKWQLKVFKFFPGSREKHPQMRIGLELVPRNKDEKKFAGFFVMSFRAITPKTQFLYVPVLDALDVSASDFLNRTKVNSEGDILRIGNWRNTGDIQVLGQLKEAETENGGSRPDIGWIGALEDSANDDDDDELDEEIDEDDLVDDDEFDDDEFDDEEEDEPEPPKRRTRTAAKSTPPRRGTVTRGTGSRGASSRGGKRSAQNWEDDPF